MEQIAKVIDRLGIHLTKNPSMLLLYLLIINTSSNRDAYYLLKDSSLANFCQSSRVTSCARASALMPARSRRSAASLFFSLSPDDKLLLSFLRRCAKPAFTTVKN